MTKQKPTMPVPEECETCRYWRAYDSPDYVFPGGRHDQDESICGGLPPLRATTTTAYKKTIFGRKYVASVTDHEHRRVVTRKHDTCALHKYAKEYTE